MRSNDALAGRDVSSDRGSDFTSPALVRLLAAHAPVDIASSGLDIAERLSPWLDTFDAIGLQSSLQTIRTLREPIALRRGERPRSAADLRADAQRTRAALAHAIGQEVLLVALAGDPLAELQRRRSGGASSALTAQSRADAVAAAYQHRHLELARQMEQLISPLRDHVRQSVGRISGRLRQLAALDEALEAVTAKREQAVMPVTATLATRRLAHWHETLAGEEASGDPAHWRQPGGWLHAFEQEWRQALAAEADLRMEPVIGLIEALDQELKQAT